MFLRYVVPLAATLAVGCASGAGAEDPPVAAREAAFSAADADELTLTIVASKTGGNSDPNRVTVMEVAAAEVNELGGVRGHKLRLTAEDNASSEALAREIITRLLAPPKVPDVLFGTHTSNVLPLVQLAASKHTFVFGGGSSLPNVVDNATAEGAQYFARTTPSGNLVAQRLAQLTYEDGASQIGVVYLADTVSTQYKDDFVAKFRELGGTVFPEAIQGVPPTSTNPSYSAQFASALAGAGQVRGRPAVVVIGSGTQLKTLLRDATAANVAVQWYTSHGVQSGDALAENPAAAEGLRGVKPAKGEASHFDHYAARLAASHPGIKPDGTAYPNMYDEILLFALAAERGGLSANGIRTSIREVSNADPCKIKLGPEHLAAALVAVRLGVPIDFDGASGSLELDARGDVAAGFEEFHVTGGAFVSGGTL